MALDGWMVALSFNLLITVSFLGVALALGLSLGKGRQWRQNPLAVGTFLIFLTCGAGHGLHAIQLLQQDPTGAAARAESDRWSMWVVDGLTATAGVGYWALRRRFPGLVSGAALFEDLRVRQAEALEINDNVVQGLARAKLALEVGQGAEGDRAVAESLEASKRIISNLLGAKPVEPGSLRRSTEADRHGV